ncbi:MAG TPA: glycosyltransferase [Terriglobales bacterium]|jgi:dolichol-phosphate mannosyltransferase|nr:glycosyltransferase [Terriglobales bacterium]
MTISVEQNLKAMEWSRESYWLRYPSTSPVKLRWRALAVRHCFHVLPEESILELGAGSGLWTEHLASIFGGENPIVAAVFNQELFAADRQLANTRFTHVQDLLKDLPAESFDYIVGTGILCHDQYPQNLWILNRLLKPGGQILFFENNYWNPQVFLKTLLPSTRKLSGEAPCQIGMRKYHLLQMASHQGFTNIDVIPYDIIHPLTPRFLIRFVQSIAFVFEHAPVVRELCGTLYIWARKPGDDTARRPAVNLARHPKLFGSVSVVVPCHNEEMNIPNLVHSLVRFYDKYIYEIIIVNDNSRDRTAEVTLKVAQQEPRVKLVDRKPPNGVGRALRDGYAAASGQYILSMDCDFVQILPEFRDLFDVVAAGHDGAIGSRFSHDSMLINYPFFKIICNRAFHLLVKLFLLGKVRDISNNLKLYRAHIFKNLKIEEAHFAANVETGLKPLLAGYDIHEVPMSWVNRTIEMGKSSFRILNVAPHYFLALLKTLWRAWRGKAFYAENVSPAHLRDEMLQKK